MQLCGSLRLVGPVSALLTVLAFIHLSRSSSPASSSSHLFHQWSRGSPRATSSSTTKATTVHAPAATEATSVSTTAASEHSTRATAVHEATLPPRMPPGPPLPRSPPEGTAQERHSVPGQNAERRGLVRRAGPALPSLHTRSQFRTDAGTAGDPSTKV